MSIVQLKKLSTGEDSQALPGTVNIQSEIERPLGGDTGAGR